MREEGNLGNRGTKRDRSRVGVKVGLSPQMKRSMNVCSKGQSTVAFLQKCNSFHQEGIPQWFQQSL